MVRVLLLALQLGSLGCSALTLHKVAQDHSLTHDKKSLDDVGCRPLEHMYVINVEGDRGATRRKLVQKELDMHGLKATFWPANTADTIGEWYKDEERNAAAEVRARDGHSELSEGELALSMSHKKIYQEIQKGNIPCALILEDDVNFACGFKPRLENFVNSDKMPSDFHIIKLDHCSPHPGAPIGDSSTEELNLLQGSQGPCTSGYIVSKEGAAYLEAGNTPLWMNADGNMDPAHLQHTGASGLGPLKDYAVDPQIVYQANEAAEGGIWQMRQKNTRECGKNN